MRFEIHGKMKSLIAGTLCSLAFGLWACSDEVETPVVAPNLSELFENIDDADIDLESHAIVLPEGTDSFTVDNIAALGGKKCYLALDDDPVDPEIDWDNPVSTGTTLAIGEEGLRLVVLDESNRVVDVWTISLPEGKSSSSVAPASSDDEKVSSSSEEKTSSSSEEPAESSSSEIPASSSEEPESSSSEMLESSSSEEEVSSSSEPESSASEPVKLSELSVSKGTVTVQDSLVYVELPYGADLAKVALQPLDTVNDLRRRVAMEFADDSGNVATYNVVAGVQLPGSDFSSRDDFWATTSDAMATKKTSAAITVSSSANLEFNDGMATITTREVEGKFVIIEGSWKMAGGFYFSGEYAGQTALDIYEQGSDGGTPSTGDSYIANDMTFGKPFTARPTAFEITYSYSHVKGKSTDYPQKSLVYVMLVGKNGKVVATGAFSDSESTDMATRRVELSYGKDPFGLLDGGYAVAEGLTLGTGNEDVTAIHVMFASSAYAHVVSGGTLGNDDKYRGGENAALVLDDFKLIY
ncbi:MAG: PCMD domain-containing protein [Fibrobacter sp.]|nr:PCMD domain-containing protein [Fibrobacter sp.]